MTQPIIHDEEHRRFSCSVEGKNCSVEYDLKQTEPETMDICRIFVEPELRGKGIAQKLLVSASEFARSTNRRVVPSCSYAVEFYRRHAEYTDVLADGVDLENGGSCRIPGR